MIQAIRIGILIFIIGLSVFTEFYIVVQLLYSDSYLLIGYLLAALLAGLITLSCVEIWRIRRE